MNKVNLCTILVIHGYWLYFIYFQLSASPSSSLHILNAILGLCEYPRCMDQLLYWKRQLRNRTQRLAYGDGFDLPLSKGPGAHLPKHGEGVGDVITDYDETLPALLCDMWRDEEKRWGVLRDPDGCISSKSHYSLHFMHTALLHRFSFCHILISKLLLLRLLTQVQK